jgi:hypothetical protein
MHSLGVVFTLGMARRSAAEDLLTFCLAELEIIRLGRERSSKNYYRPRVRFPS